MGRTMHACLALLLLACVGAAQLIYPDNDAHALMTALPGESATLFFESYFYSISGTPRAPWLVLLLTHLGMAIAQSGSLYLAEDVHNRIYEAVYTTSNRALSPAPFLQQDGVVGADIDRSCARPRLTFSQARLHSTIARTCSSGCRAR